MFLLHFGAHICARVSMQLLQSLAQSLIGSPGTEIHSSIPLRCIRDTVVIGISQKKSMDHIAYGM